MKPGQEFSDRLAEGYARSKAAREEMARRLECRAERDRYRAALNEVLVSTNPYKVAAAALSSEPTETS